MAEPVADMDARDDAGRVAALLEECWRVLHTEPLAARELALEALQVATGRGDLHGHAESLRLIAYSHEFLSDYSAALEHATRALELYQEAGDEIGVANAQVCIGIIQRDRTAYGPALEAFRVALETFRKHDDPLRTAATYNNIGVVYEGYGDFDAAITAYLEALRIYEERGETLNTAIVTANVGNIYYYLGDVDASFSFYNRAHAAYRQISAPIQQGVALSNISSLYKARGDYDAALDALEGALALFQEMGERRHEATSLVKIGMLHELRGKPDAAGEYLRRGIEIAVEVGSRETYADGWLRLGNLLYGQGNHTAAIDALGKALEVALETSAWKMEYEIRHALVMACEGSGAIAEAFGHLKRNMELKDRIFGEERQKAIAEMQARFDVERAERERETFRLKSEHLEEMMEQKSKEVTLLAMQLAQRNAFLGKLRKDARKLSKDAGAEVKSALETLLADLSQNVHTEGEWERFEQEFQQVHHDYVQRLSQRHPKLSPTELRICALLKINLSTKEIANLLSVSVRNVESHRYWIRKKIGLPSEANLTTYLTSL